MNSREKCVLHIPLRRSPTRTLYARLITYWGLLGDPISLTGGALAPPRISCNQNQHRADSHLWCFAHSFASGHYGGGP